MTRLAGAAVLIAALLLRPASTPQAYCVLFIGNSLTAANGLPALVQAMARASGISMRVGAVALPNFSLEDHLQRGEAERAIQREAWTHVVLQQGPSALPESRVALVRDVKRFDAIIRRRGARTCVYMVWPSRQRSFDFDGVVASYTAAAGDVHAILIPAGQVWRAAWTEDSTLALYGSDGFHPSPLGSDLAALTIYQRIVGALPSPVEGEPAVGAQRQVLERAVRAVQ